MCCWKWSATFCLLVCVDFLSRQLDVLLTDFVVDGIPYAYINMYLQNGNTPHIYSQTHISVCVCISVHYKVSQTAQLTAGVKNLTHTHKKDCRPLPTAHTPPTCILASKSHHSHARERIWMHVNAFQSATKVPANTLNGPKKFGRFGGKIVTRNAS